MYICTLIKNILIFNLNALENIITNPEQKTPKKRFLQFPWGYKEGFILAGAILLIGIILELVSQGGVKFKLQYPTNIIILLVLINIIFLLHAYAKNNSFIRWLSTVPAAISAISLLVFLVLLMGFIPQEDSKAYGFIKSMGFSHITSSIPFILSQFYLFISLGLVTIRRATPLKGKNIGFLLNHAGLWITLAAAGLGSGDMLRLHMDLSETNAEPTFIAKSNDNSKEYRLRIALKLIDFKMEEYPPKMGIVDNATGELMYKKGDNLVEISKGMHKIIGEWNIYVKEFYADAGMNDSIYIPINQVGASPAAFVEVKNIKNGKLIKGWISAGSFLLPYKGLKLDDKISLGMASPEPKKFSSEIEYLTEDGKTGKTIIEVNKPFKLKGWKIYQTGYKEEFGKWSPYSTLELVQDRWLPVVYFGLFLIMAGAAYIFWMGRKQN